MSDSETDSPRDKLLPLYLQQATITADGARKQAEKDWMRHQGTPDKLLETIYQYYRGGGYQTLVLTRASNLLILGFLHLFTVYLIYGVNWKALHRRPDSGPIQLEQIGCCSVFCLLQRLTLTGWLFTLLVSAGWWWAAAQFWLIDRPKWQQARRLYRCVLGLRDRQLSRIDFDRVMERVIAVNSQAKYNLCKRLDKVDMCARVMRRENYLIALFNKELVDFKVPLSKPLEWALTFTILGYVFDNQNSFTVHPRFLTRRPGDKQMLVEGLMRRCRVVGMLGLLLSPLVFLLTLCYLIFRYGEEMYRNPRSIAARQYTLTARWRFREYNELPHYFEGRLAATQRKANKYMDQFHSARIVAIARLVSFIAGAVFLVLAGISVIDEDAIVNLQLPFGKSVLWYLGALGAVLAISRGLQPDGAGQDDPGRLLSQLIDRLHYCLPSWSDDFSSPRCHADFGALYPYKLRILLNDLLGTILTPLVLLFLLPERADALIDFFREFTVHVDGLGYVCSFSLFDFNRLPSNGNLTPDNKLGASMLSFHERHAVPAGSLATVVMSEEGRAAADSVNGQPAEGGQKSIISHFYK